MRVDTPEAKGRLLKYSVDRASIDKTLACVGVQLAMYFTPGPLWLKGMLLAALLYMIRWPHLVEHNAAHLPLFHHQWLNDSFDVVMCLSTGMPIELYRIHHVEVHHKFTNRPEDWTGPFAFTDTHFYDRPVNRLRYIVVLIPRAWRRCIPLLIREGHHRAQRRFVVCMVLVGGAWTLLAWHNLESFLIFYIVPWIVASLGLANANWRHHVGCSYQTPETTANVDTSWWSGPAWFNIGYHSTHHEWPNLHWSLLRDYWQEYNCDKTPPEYIRRFTNV